MTELFEAFVREQTPGLVRSAYLLTGSGPATEDLVQDTLLRLLARWDRVQAAEVPIAYVRRSLVNNFLNSRRRRPELPYGDAVLDNAEPDLAVAVSNRDLARRLLAQLPAKQRAIVVMRYLDDLSDNDIARAVGCRPGTVRSTISRSLAVLRASDINQDVPGSTVAEERT